MTFSGFFYLLGVNSGCHFCHLLVILRQFNSVMTQDMTINVLVVDDESAIRDMVRFSLERAGMKVSGAENAAQALQFITDDRPDIVLLDWMMPGMSGVDLIKRLKKDALTKEVPVIMLTARDEESDMIKGLDSGADDYLTKPFSPRELIARIKAVLRRMGHEEEGEEIRTGNLLIDMSSHRVLVNGDEIEMGPTEFRLLHFFMTHAERVYSRAQLLDHVWGANVYIEDRTVDVHIRRLRKVLTPVGCEQMIQTVRGSGYRFSTKI